MALILIAVAWMVGIVAEDHRPAAPAHLLFTALAAGGLAALIRRSQAATRIAPQLPLAFVLLCAALLGAWRSALARPAISEASIWRWVGHEVIVDAEIEQEPRWTETEQRLVVEARAVLVEGSVRPAEGRLLVVLPPEPARRLGERLVLTGIVAAPPAGRGFDYAAYLRRRGIYAVLERAAVRRATPPASSPRVALLSLKAEAHHSILRLLPEPEAGLLSGILLGLQSALPREIYDAFNKSGTSHILVISGWNISITIAAALWLAGLAGIPRWPATLLALGAVALYVALVGPTPAVVRSAVMGAVVALADPLHRRSDPWTALAFACLVLSAIDPQVVWDLGFQLSAGAVAGLFACGAALNARAERLLRLRALRWAAEPLAATLAAQVFTLPLLLYHFGRLSLIAPLANIVLLPAVPIAMALGALMTLAGLLLWPLGQLLAVGAWLPLAWLTRGAQLFAGLPFASVDVPLIPTWLLLLYYGITITALLAWNSLSKRGITEQQPATSGSG